MAVQTVVNATVFSLQLLKIVNSLYHTTNRKNRQKNIELSIFKKYRIPTPFLSFLFYFFRAYVSIV